MILHTCRRATAVSPYGSEKSLLFLLPDDAPVPPVVIISQWKNCATGAPGVTEYLCALNEPVSKKFRADGGYLHYHVYVLTAFPKIIMEDPNGGSLNLGREWKAMSFLNDSLATVDLNRDFKES